MAKGQMIAFLFMLSSVSILVLYFAILFTIKAIRQKSRRSLLACLIFYIQAYGITSILIDAFKSDNIATGFMFFMPPKTVLLGFVPLVIILLYLIELKRPCYLSWTQVAIYLLPYPILAGLLFVFSDNILEISSLSVLRDNLTRPDVIVRLAILLLYLIYSAIAFAIPYEKDSNGQKIGCRKALDYVFIGAVIFFVLGFNFNIFVALILNFVCVVLTDILIIYLELQKESILKKSSSRQVTRSNSYFFDNNDVWMDPDMTMERLSRMMGTNQKYLLDQIKKAGYMGYVDMINSKRVKYICEQLSHNSSESPIMISQLMFEAGFRSRSTANSAFKKVMGCTPSEYIEKL